MILVTGSTGFIGRSLMRALGREDRPVRAFGGQITNLISLREQVEDVDTVIHLAGAESRGRSRLLRSVDVRGTEILIKACQRKGVKHVIYLSRLNANPDLVYPLLRAKGEAERLIRRSGIPYTIVRSASLFGRDDRFLNVIASLAFWSVPFVWLPAGGNTPFQPLWVEDLVRCLTELVDRDEYVNRTIALAGDERLHYREIVQHVLRASGLRRIPLRMPLLLSRAAATVAFATWRRPPVSRLMHDRFSTPEVTDLNIIPDLFGFRPQRMIAQIPYLRRSGLPWWIFQRN